jgi:4-hydroxy-tetrahydrodipicolinate reductase
MKTFRVVAWGTGYLGKQGVSQIIRDPALELVGLKVAAPEKVGVDAGVIAGTDATGVLATDDAATLLALKPDCVAYFANTAGRDEASVADIVPFLEAGVNVSTISHFDMQYPRHGQKEFVAPLLAAAEAGQSSILLTGEEPGFAFGQHLFSILSTCQGIKSVRFVEMSDVQHYGGTESLNMYGFNGNPKDMPPMFTSHVGSSWHVGTLLGIADFLNVDVQDVTQSWENEVFGRPIDTAAYGVLNPGCTAATRWTVTAHALGRPLLTYQKILRMHHEAAPEWESTRLGKGEPGVTHKIFVDGDTTVREELFRPSGASATPTIAVNAIPYVCDARPGVLLQQDLPLFPPRIFR